MTTRKQLPPRDIQWIDAQGRSTEIFFDYIKNLEGRSLGQPVSITDTPANGETPLYNSTTGLWEFGANRDSPMVATIAMTFDTDVTTYTNALWDMSSKGIPGTFFVDSSRVGLAGQPSKDNLVLMAAIGWEIGARVYGTINGAEANMVAMWTNSRLAAIDRLKAQRDEMYALGFDIKSISASQRAWSGALRGVASHLFENVRVADIVSYGTLPVSDRLYVRDGGSASWSGADTVASLCAWLDGLIAAGPTAFACPIIHRIDTSGDPNYTIHPSVLQGFTSYLQTKIAAGVVRATTLRDAVGD